MTVTRKEILEGFVSRLQQILDSGEIPPWQKPWTPQYGQDTSRLHNPVTGQPYKGLNSLDLDLKAALAGYDDPRWMGFRQAADQGWRVNKGEKATFIHLPVEVILNREGDMLDPNTTPDGKPGRILLFKRVPVFNAQQIDGIPPLTRHPAQDLQPRTETLDVMAKRMGVRVAEVSGDQACYQTLSDSITLPVRVAFKDPYSHDSTLAHELAHATGHASRLKRDLEGPFGSIRYSAEEVTAEIASYLTCKQLGIPFLGGNPDMSLEQHVAYTAHWASNLQTQPKVLSQAIHNGVRASRFLFQQLELDQIKHLDHQAGLQSRLPAGSVQPGVELG